MNKNIAYIDSLKGLGALIIAFYHISGLIGIPDSSTSLINKTMFTLSAIGYIPVEMFFFFSGYLMLYNYSDKIKEIEFLDYTRKRVRMVYPLLFVNIVLCSLYIVIGGGQISIYDTLYNLLFLQSGYIPGGGDYRIDIAGGGTWFLAPLFLAYSLFFYICKYKSQEKAFGLYGVIVIIGLIALKNGWNFPILNGYMLRGLLGFFAGCIFSVIIKRYGFKINIFGLLFAIVIFISYMSIIYRGEYANTIDFIIMTDLVILPCTMILIENITWIRKFLSLSILQRIGVLSMELFFLNLPIGYFFKILIGDNIAINEYYQYGLYFIILILASLIYKHSMKSWRKIRMSR
ncbi:acyltransferase [Paenibacillus xylanexedens]|uniref:acyltransferase family protein n=1 Tax=Paenibacillus xylanexedens TaxID=528191 RepID=UPI001C8E34CE|nr:acyltransferase family protein [Paenibacillus xylanexedens]MBY0118883.1 acyltransferase [Paenibacillus xylanexedens]